MKVVGSSKEPANLPQSVQEELRRNGRSARMRIRLAMREKMAWTATFAPDQALFNAWVWRPSGAS
ncbi:MAG: hypothetical protein C7B46_12855 [Sulfobacillus benefaciens]|uniref:Uncharacterized protein n=1 Tax=Sulfobacillus benefaciens TaxID=453960 RepID=A0A2T2XE40_9FIRM|nr:MAG: hypothetical protein C7B46_12855 [Sulfobacillus benefaciens]